MGVPYKNNYVYLAENKLIRIVQYWIWKECVGYLNRFVQRLKPFYLLCKAAAALWQLCNYFLHLAIICRICASNLRASTRQNIISKCLYEARFPGISVKIYGTTFSLLLLQSLFQVLSANKKCLCTKCVCARVANLFQIFQWIGRYKNHFKSFLLKKKGDLTCFCKVYPETRQILKQTLFINQ